MSNPESFIDEVNEEVRRDQLFAVLRKWGWVGVLGVVIIVGGATVNEVVKSRQMKAAQATGDAILAALDGADGAARAEALTGIEADGDAGALLALMAAAEAEDAETADRLLAEIADNAALPVLYRDLAVMKRVMLAGSPMSAADKQAALESILAPGSPFRVLAEEQLALADIEAGDTEAALGRLQALMEDAEAGDTVRQRASQLIVALGGTVDE